MTYPNPVAMNDRSYLVKTGSVQLDSKGNGVLTIKPDVGQYWLPSMLRVSTINQAFPRAYCAIYHGGVGSAAVAATGFVDDTYTGNGDTTSMVSGLVVEYGEGITAQFIGGNPNDTATVTILGTSMSAPPGIGDMPPPAGSHFSGKVEGSNVGGMISRPLSTIAANAVLSFPTTGTFFVGNLPSIYLTASVGGTPGQQGLIIEAVFTSDSNGNNTVATHRWDILPGDTIDQGVPILGPYMILEVFAGNASLTNFGMVLAQSPTLGTNYSGVNGMDFVGIDTQTVNAGTDLFVDINLVKPGWCKWSVGTSATAWFCKVFAIDSGLVKHLIDITDNGGPGKGFPRLIYLPPSHIQFQFHNGDGTAQNVSLTMTRATNS